MISIIICSKNPTLLTEVSENVKQTIGVPYEIIAVDNQDGKYGICNAYNIGAAMAKYAFFCFMHEDISFVTQDWGRHVIKHLKDNTVGLIGVVGAHPTTFLPCSFNASLLLHEANILVHPNDRSKPPQHAFKTINPSDQSIIKPVTGIDGVWMCTRREVYEQHQFDDKTLVGFHGYDADFSLQILHGGYKVCVVFDILMYHYSSGYTNYSHMEQYIKLTKKWGEKSIVLLKDKPKKEIANYHWVAMSKFTEELFSLKYKSKTILKHYFLFSLNGYFKLKPFLSILTFIIRKTTVNKLTSIKVS